MSFADKIQKRIAEIKEIVADPSTVPDEIAKQRLTICESCEQLNKALYTCKRCGCFMKLKTKLAVAECPLEGELKKWGKYEPK